MKILPTAVITLFYIFACGIHVRAQEAIEESFINVDSLENVLQSKELSKNDLLLIYWDLSKGYVNDDNHEKTMYYARKGIVLAEEMKNLFIATDLYIYLGISYDYINSLDSAMLYYEKALEIVARMEKEKDEKPERVAKIKASVYGSIANLYCIQGKTEEALGFYFMALKLLEQYNINYDIAIILGNISVVYFNVDNYEQSELYLLRKEKICRENGYEINLAHTLTNLGATYDRMQKTAEALAVTEEALDIYQRYNTHPVLQLTCYINLSSIHIERLGNDVKAMEYADLALQKATELQIPLQICYALMQQSYVYLFRKNFVAAEKSALDALRTDSTNLSVKQLLYECIAKANIGMGNTDRANDFFDRFKQSQATYANENFQEKLSEMEVKYETEKKEMRILVIEKEKRQMIRLSVTAVVVLFLALTACVFLWRWAVQKKRLAEQQKLLAEQEVIQLQQEKQLIATQAVLDGEVQERTRLARDLHDGLGSILAATKYNLVDSRKASSQEVGDVECFEKAMKLLDESMREMRRVAHHLMPESLSRHGLKQSISDFCDSVPHAKFSYYGDESRLDPKTEVMVYRVMHELVSNALKHSGASQILVQIVRETNRIALTVQDNGCGFDPLIESKCMGLTNIRTRVAAYNGILLIDSKPEVGTEINVELKIETLETV